MSELIAIAFANREKAQQAREEFALMAREHLVELEDSVVAYKTDKGDVKLDPTMNLTALGATQGLFWGFLVGALVAIPTQGAAIPVVTSAVGAGAVGGKLSDFGIEDDMMKEISKKLDQGAVLFVLLRKVTSDKVAQHLQGHDGQLVKTSLPDDVEAQLARALHN